MHILPHRATPISPSLCLLTIARTRQVALMITNWFNWHCLQLYSAAVPSAFLDMFDRPNDAFAWPGRRSRSNGAPSPTSRTRPSASASRRPWSPASAAGERRPRATRSTVAGQRRSTVAGWRTSKVARRRSPRATRPTVARLRRADRTCPGRPQPVPLLCGATTLIVRVLAPPNARNRGDRTPRAPRARGILVR